MKIFPKDARPHTPSAAKAPSNKKEGKITRKKSEAPIKKELDAAEIKEKLAAHVSTSDAAKNMAIKNNKMLGQGFMNEKPAPIVEAPIVEVKASEENNEEEIKTPNTKDLTIKSDIALNDPKDTNTQEKLKTVLSRGAFSFNSKERDALEKILAD